MHRNIAFRTRGGVTKTCSLLQSVPKMSIRQVRTIFPSKRFDWWDSNICTNPESLLEKEEIDNIIFGDGTTWKIHSIIHSNGEHCIVVC